MRLLLFFFGISFCAKGQFIGLATPSDGSRIYFATTLRPKNTTQPLWGKLFQVDASGLQLVLSRDEQIPPPPPSTTQAVQTNAYDVFAASVSVDGTVFAVTARRACAYGDCIYVRLEGYSTTVTSGGQSKDYPGSLQLSANGQWAFGGSSFGVFTHPAYLFNLATGEGGALDQIIPSRDAMNGLRIASTSRTVADDGTFAYSTGKDIVMIHGADVYRIPGNGDTHEPVMDRSGRTIVFAVGDTIRLADSSRTTSSLLIDDGFAPSISDDGQTLVYLANRTKPQLHVYRFGGASRQLGFDPAGIAKAIVSGDGSTIYAVTLGGRLLKLSAVTGEMQELVPRTPYLTGGGPRLAPNKLTALPGVGLTDLSFTADAPLPDMLNGVHVNIQGKTALIQSLTPEAITVLVPPDVVPSVNGTVTSPINVSLTSPSPFDSPHVDANIAPYAPDALSLPGSNTVLAAHQDWHALVTVADPAMPGEVLHVYAVGLGDTVPPVAYGQPAPVSEPLARLAIPISCADSNNTRNALEISYQGLAPGFAGAYQIDVRLPSDFSGKSFGLYCVLGGIGSGGPGFGGAIPIAGP